MLNFVLLDDDPSHNDTLESALKLACSAENLEGRIVLKATTAAEVTDFAASFSDRAIYFLDIVLTNERLPGRETAAEINGLDVSRLVSENSKRPNYIVYISAYSEYGIAGLHTHAFDFLIKPFKIEELRACLRAIVRDIEKRSSYTPSIDICGDRLQVDQVLYISSGGNYSFVHTLSGTRKYRVKISELSARILPEGFKRIHRKYIVNQRFVSTLWRKEGLCILTDSTELPVSKKYEL